MSIVGNPTTLQMPTTLWKMLICTLQRQRGKKRNKKEARGLLYGQCRHISGSVYTANLFSVSKCRVFSKADVFATPTQDASFQLVANRRQIIQPSFERITLLVLICLVCPIRSLDPVMAFCACRCIVRKPLTQDMSLRPRGPLRHSELFDSDSQPYSPLFVLLIEAITYPMRPHWRRK